MPWPEFFLSDLDRLVIRSENGGRSGADGSDPGPIRGFPYLPGPRLHAAILTPPNSGTGDRLRSSVALTTSEEPLAGEGTALASLDAGASEKFETIKQFPRYSFANFIVNRAVPPACLAFGHNVHRAACLDLGGLLAYGRNAYLAGSMRCSSGQHVSVCHQSSSADSSLGNKISALRLVTLGGQCLGTFA